jgi:hypothetical protein
VCRQLTPPTGKRRGRPLISSGTRAVSVAIILLERRIRRLLVMNANGPVFPGNGRVDLSSDQVLFKVNIIVGPGLFGH